MIWTNDGPRKSDYEETMEHDDARECWRALWWVLSRAGALLLLYYFIVYAIEAM